MAQETLAVSRAINASSPLTSDDIRGQRVSVYDAATGQVALRMMVSPIMDAGGNVAISPSGRRVAVLNAGRLEVFELPAAPAVPVSSVPDLPVSAPGPAAEFHNGP
jgi:hypothetical protein